MQGYHNLDEANAEVLVEKAGMRGFRSGDMGRIDEDGFLFITGRVKEQYKLLNGKYVVPTPLEEKIKLSPYISNIMVHGVNREYNVAVVIPDYEVLKGWAKERGLDADPSSLAKNQKVHALMEQEVDRLSAEFKGYEKIRRLYVGEEDFTTDNGMLTPTLKLKRRVVQQRYGDVLESLYR
jgi:long-chain acyl-CoA synthetase